MKALSLINPWPVPVLEGVKPVENRDWATSYRGPILIHASKCMDRRFTEAGTRIRALWPKHPPLLAGRCTFGAIVGIVEIIDCVRLEDIALKDRTVWHFGPWCWGLANPRTFSKPIPYKGMPGVFNVPHSVVAHEMEAVA